MPRDVTAEVRRKGAKALSLTVGLAGLLIIVFSWAVDHKSPWAMMIAAPKYAAAMTCYQSLIEKDSVFESSDRGFTELRSVLEDDLHGPGDLSIASFRATHVGYSNLPGGFSEPTVTVEVTLEDGTTLEGPVTLLKSRIEARYLKTPLTRASMYLLWVGIGLSLSGLILAARSGPTV